MMLRLIYFPVPGRAEACRVALAFSDLEWEDVEVTGVRFEIMKTDRSQTKPGLVKTRTSVV